MKLLCSILGLVLAITACTQTQNSGNASDSMSLGDQAAVSVLPDTLCFERYSGTSNQDTASIMLILDGDVVTGRYDNRPYEKDSRIGTINGTRIGDTIRGSWLYQQEGMMDTLAFAFRLNGDLLLQKPTNFNANTGRESLTDTASFSLQYAKINCR